MGLPERLGSPEARFSPLFYLAKLMAAGGGKNYDPMATKSEKAAESSNVQSAEEYLRVLMEETSDFIMIADAAGKPVLFNDAYSEMMKASLGFDLEPGMQPHKLTADPEVEAFWDGLHERVLGGERFTIVYSHLIGGSRRHLSVSFNPITRDGEVIGFAELSRDITDLKGAEAALRATQEDLLAAQEIACIGTYDYDLRRGTWTGSRILYDIFGLESEGALDFDVWVAGVHPDDRASMVAYFQNEVLGQVKPFDREYRVVRATDSGVRWVHGLGRLYLDDEGVPVRMLGTIRDITARVESQELARQNQAEALRRRYVETVLRAQEDERRHIARELHDEAGQSLASISVRLAALESAPDLDAVREQAVGLRGLVADVSRELTRLSRGLHPHVLEDLGFEAAVGRLAEDFEKQHLIRTQVQTIGDFSVHPLDRSLSTISYRIVQESLTNVARHSHASSASVIVHITSSSLSIIVEDDGIGIGVDDTPTGRGMGLFGIRERVSLLGGTMVIESGTSGGTTLNVRLPRSVEGEN